ncbi:MAG: hypothetical protein IKI04_02455, partial [Bacilli bacterium]|nr:hypothetical protein [Bacilli bacterium]
YNSSVKGIIDAWYRENFSTKTSLLEDAVYCNARNITYYGGYNPNGGPLTTDYLLQFKNHQTSTNLACSNLTDQFSTSNNKAKLTYPVSLLEAEEAHNVNSATLMGTGANYWRLSPAYAVSYSRVRYLTYEGSSQVDIVDNLYDVRPVISLANDVEVLEGKGSETNPWIIDDVVFPTQIKNIIDNESCIEEYEGQVTDKVGVTETAKHIYFNKCSNKRNIIFNNMCWQMIRTTETGGIKMIYNGIPENGKCESTRSNQTGFVGTTGEIQQINSNYLYGSSFTYDITNNTFTLTDTNLATWSDSTYENLIGKYTCKNITGTCTTLYNVNGYSTNNSAIITSYTIGSTNYASIGTSPFNANNRLHSMVGYMFNKAFPINTTQPGTTSYKYGNSFTYSNGTYTLSGTTKNISNWSTGYTQLDNTHYTCWNTTGTCSTISYIYFVNETNASYINITDGKNVNDILNDMLNNDNVNRYNSSAKGIIDAWYRENLSIKTNMLEDAVYCNARNITNYGGWDPNGPLATNYSLQFKNYSGATDLSCQNITDQFAVSNNKAKLAYPTSLLEAEEAHNINNGSLMSIGANYWRLSPGYSVTYARVRYLTSEGSSVTDTVDKPFNIRPVVSLKEGTTFTGGDGSTTNPWTVYEGEKLYDTLINLSQEENSCINKYAGNVTDRLGITETANHVYFDNCENKRNIIFGGFCWQVIRTTETGGTKLIYNGEPVNGKCESTRTDHKGIVGANGTTQTLNAEYLYGDSFIYDITTNTFTLTDTTTATWSDSTYENLLGKFTCKNTVGTCTTLYNVNGYSNNTTAYTSAYTISDTNYAQIGTSAFNAYYRSPAMVGYMFNKVYEYAGNRAPTTGSLMGNDVSY